MNSVVGHCPKCGAPIYSPSTWMGITPPPATHTCSCNSSVVNPAVTTFTFPTEVIQGEICYTKKQIEDIFDFMYRSRWKIEKDTYNRVAYAFKWILKKHAASKTLQLDDVFKEIDDMDKDSSEYPL